MSPLLSAATAGGSGSTISVIIFAVLILAFVALVVALLFPFRRQQRTGARSAGKRSSTADSSPAGTWSFSTSGSDSSSGSDSGSGADGGGGGGCD
jgi:flagellar basal body-associated protein FliL